MTIGEQERRGKGLGRHRDAVVAAAIRNSVPVAEHPASAAPVGARGADQIGLRVGDDVHHERFGEGVIVDIEGTAETPQAGPAFAQRAIDDFLRENWPFGPPYPAVYYDPLTAIPGPPWVSMHAKCIVVDDEWAFVTSANFTARGQTRNLEVGVCIEDRAFAGQLATQWWSLVTRGLVVAYR